MSIKTKMALWWTWTRIAVRQCGLAAEVRASGAPGWKFESPESASLSLEFERSMTAIAACAFAMEALSKELEDGGLMVDTSNLKPGKKVSKGYYVGHHIVQAFDIAEPDADNFVNKLDHLFSLRNDAVHFESPWREGAHLHPAGTYTAFELTVYTLEEALLQLAQVRDILVAIKEAIGEERHHKAADHVALNIEGVLEMMDEVIRNSGLHVQHDEKCNG